MSAYFLLFVMLATLCQNVATEYKENSTEQIEIVSRSQTENNFNKPAETTIMTFVVTNEINFYINELSNLSEKNFKLYGKIHGKGKNETQEILRQRKSRDAMNGTDLEGLECLSCFADGISTEDENCYKGSQVKIKNCSDAEQCYTELHPLYIKRGCILPGGLNRTFVCKCPLCNDKPSYDSTYYEYTRFSDWEYDNKQLQKPMMVIDLICKLCETKGVNKTVDNICRNGRNADYIVCGHDQLCYTNIDDQFDFLSRGCITKPIFNSLHYICNTAKCNNVIYQNPKLMPPTDILFRTTPLTRRLVSGTSCDTFCYNLTLFTFAMFLIRSYYN